ncbi:MAG TPA: CheR family methyltransferase [Chloroflexota bacterium]|nr:CheR family methyltransferase [Chloroflexota bacterium]
MGSLIGEGLLDPAELDLLEILLHDYGFDYRAMPVARLRSKIQGRVEAEQLQTVRGLREKMLHDEGSRRRLLRSLTTEADAMFFEPAFYRAFRVAVVPFLRTYPFIRIWHVGCSTGEEVYSMAILLEEEGLYDRCRLYATDVVGWSLNRAREGIFPLASMQEYTANYVRAGGREAFSEYYTARYDNAIFRPSLKRNVIFAQHNLATDGPFNEFQAILCRGVLPALGAPVQARGHELFRTSLVRLGFLCLGASETIDGSARSAYELFSTGGIYRRIY